MRIVYDHQVFSLQNAGGASRYHYELAAELSAAPDVSLGIFLGLSASVYPFPALEKGVTRVVSWATTLRPGLPRYALNEFLTGSRLLFHERCDIYHPTLYRKMPVVRSNRVVVTHHDCVHERYPQLFRDASRVISAKRRLYRSADCIICVSESSRKDLLQYYDVNPSKVRVVHHGLTRLRRAPEVATVFTQRLKRPYLLYVGARYGYKNFRALLDAYSVSGLSADLDMIAIGGGPVTSEERAFISKLGLSDNVIFVGQVEDAVLAEAYERAELFTYPSLYEGFGIPPLEAMSLSCSVLAANASAVTEVCKDAAFYFDPSIEGDLTRALTRAVYSSDRKQKVERGLQIANGYTWSECASKTLAIYRSI